MTALPDHKPGHNRHAAAAERLQFGDCVLDLAAQRLLRAGQTVPLSPRYFAVLVHLARSGGRLVAKEELLDAVWGHRHVSDSVLKVAINAVRAALDDNPKAPRHVETVARRGYRFLEAAPVASAAAPTPASPRPAKGNLPALQPDLIGREADLVRVQQALAGHRLVTLNGPGGVGKTRLALAAAGVAAPADGVWLLRLDALASAAPLLATVARTLGLGAAAQTGSAALARALAGSHLRLLIDNAEHLQPAVAELAAALLAGAPGVQMLVTSQVPLRVASEQVLPLAPLAVPAEGAAGGVPAAAVQLLLTRVRQLSPELAFDVAAAADAAAICRALDGLPLALELAAARVPLLGWAGVRARLGERLSLLTRGAHDAAERHRTLRAALAWTVGLLAAAEQRLLQSLSVFAGSFTVEAAIAVAGGHDITGNVAGKFTDDLADAGAVLDQLDTLRERSLLVRAGDEQPPRWRLFHSVRAFASEGLQHSGEQQAAVRRLVLHMTSVFAQADRANGSTPLLPWVARLQPEVDNLRAALQLALADPALHGAAVALFAASAAFRVRGGWRREALRDHAAILLLPALDLSLLEQAALDLAQAQLSAIAQVLPPAPALQAARRAQAVFNQAGDVTREHLALYLESCLLVRMQSPLDQRADVLQRMRALEPPSWGPLERRHRVWTEVMLLRDQGALQAFEERCAAYLASGRALGDDFAAWVAAQALAQVMAGQGRVPTAITLLERTVAEMRRCGELRENAHVLAQWAALRVTQDADADTVQGLHEAALLMHADERLWWMADALAWLPARQGRWADAVQVQAWADDLVRQRGDLRGLLFGAVRQRLGQWLAAQPDGERLVAGLAAPPMLDRTGVLVTVFGSWPQR